MLAEIVDDAPDPAPAVERRDFVALLLACFGSLFVLPDGGRRALAAASVAPPAHGSAPDRSTRFARGFCMLHETARPDVGGMAGLDFRLAPDGSGALVLFDKHAASEDGDGEPAKIVAAIPIPPETARAVAAAFFRPWAAILAMRRITGYARYGGDFAAAEPCDAGEIAGIEADGWAVELWPVEPGTPAYERGIPCPLAPFAPDYNVLVKSRGRIFLAKIGRIVYREAD